MKGEYAKECSDSYAECSVASNLWVACYCSVGRNHCKRFVAWLVGRCFKLPSSLRSRRPAQQQFDTHSVRHGCHWICKSHSWKVRPTSNQFGCFDYLWLGGQAGCLALRFSLAASAAFVDESIPWSQDNLCIFCDFRRLDTCWGTLQENPGYLHLASSREMVSAWFLGLYCRQEADSFPFARLATSTPIHPTTTMFIIIIIFIRHPILYFSTFFYSFASFHHNSWIDIPNSGIYLKDTYQL